MVALTLVANARARCPRAIRRESAKAHAVGATPAFVARHRGDAGVAVSARSRKASHRLVIARAGGEVRVHSLPLTDGSVRRLSAYPVCLSAATGFRSSAMMRRVDVDARFRSDAAPRRAPADPPLLAPLSTNRVTSWTTRRTTAAPRRLRWRWLRTRMRMRMRRKRRRKPPPPRAFRRSWLRFRRRSTRAPAAMRSLSSSPSSPRRWPGSSPRSRTSKPRTWVWRTRRVRSRISFCVSPRISTTSRSARSRRSSSSGRRRRARCSRRCCPRWITSTSPRRT